MEDLATHQKYKIFLNKLELPMSEDLEKILYNQFTLAVFLGTAFPKTGKTKAARKEYYCHLLELTEKISNICCSFDNEIFDIQPNNLKKIKQYLISKEPPYVAAQEVDRRLGDFFVTASNRYLELAAK